MTHRRCLCCWRGDEAPQKGARLLGCGSRGGEARTAPDGGIVVAGLIGNESTALMAALTALPAPKPPSLRERLERVFACAEPTRPEDVISALRAHLAEHPDATLCDVLTEGAAAHPEDAEAVGRMCGDA